MLTRSGSYSSSSLSVASTIPKFTARQKNPSMVQRMAIRRMYETLPKLGIEFARPPYSAFPFGSMDPATRAAAQ